MVSTVGGQARSAPEERWSDALRDFDAELGLRAAAAKTRRAYGGDLARSRTGARRAPSSPPRSTPATLRRYAAELSQAGLRPASLARKVASLRSFYRMLREHGVRRLRTRPSC